jgi:hypothetical protein
MRFQGRGAEGSYERLFLAESAGRMNEVRGSGWIVHMSFGSDSLGLYVSIRALLYKVVINVHMSMRSLLLRLSRLRRGAR